MSTILIGVDATERSEDAIAFGRRLADAAGATVVVASAFPYSDVPHRASNATYRHALADDARDVALDMRGRLEGIPDERAQIRIIANPSPAHALHDLADAERAALVVVGSTHTGHAGRVLPGSTGERLLHGAPCSVAVVPKDYRDACRRADPPHRRRLQRHRGGHGRRARRRRTGARLRRRARGDRRRLERSRSGPPR